MNTTWPRRSTLGRLTMTGPLVVLAAAIPFGFLIDELPLAVELAPFLLSVVLFGLPHGAVDHLVPVRLAAASLRRSLVVVGGAYFLLGGLYLAAWLVAPALALVAFLVVTWYHWGQGDVFALRRFGGADHLRTPGDRRLALMIRGGIPMVVPLLAHPTDYRRVVEAIVGLFDPAAAVALTPSFRVDARLVLGVIFAGLCVSGLCWSARHVRNGDISVAGWTWDAVEVGLLWLFFWVVPPVFAVGLYFTVWHSIRHIGRLAVLDDRSRRALDSGRWPIALGRFYRDATPLSVGALALFGGLYLAVAAEASGETLLAVYLAGIAALTLPHTAVVTWMDRRSSRH